MRIFIYVYVSLDDLEVLLKLTDYGFGQILGYHMIPNYINYFTHDIIGELTSYYGDYVCRNSIYIYITPTSTN